MIDAHQHYWRLDRGDYGWLAPDSGVLFADHLPADLQPQLAAAGVALTILVQAAPTFAETRFLLDLAAVHPSIAGVVGWADLVAGDATMVIADLVRRPRLVGLRAMAQDLPDDWLASPLLGEALDAMAAHNLALDALVRPAQLAALRVLLARHPALRVVIDHGAKPAIAAGGSPGWSEDIFALAAEFPALCCKLSGLVTEAGDDIRAIALRPYADTLLAAFGPERLMWGSDWPVVRLRCEYAEWLATARALTAGLDEAGRAALFGGTAARFYALPDA